MKWSQRTLVVVSLIGIIGIGALLRFYKLGAAPYWMDEGYTINAILSVEEHGSTILDSGKNYFCPTYCYPSAWIAKHMDDSATSYRFLAAIAGTFLVVLLFFVARDMTSTIPALFVALATATAYLEIAWSRQARWYTLFAFFFWSSIYFFYRLLYKKPKRSWITFTLMILSAVLAAITNGLGLLIPFLLGAWYAIDAVIIQKKHSWKKALLAILLTVLTFLFLDRVLGLHTLTWAWHRLNLFNNGFYYASFLWRTYWLFIVPAVLALFLAFKKETNYRTARFFLATVFLGYTVPLSFFTNTIQYRYLFQVTPVLFILGILGIADVMNYCKKVWLKGSVIAALTILFFTIGGGVVVPHTMYFLETDDPGTLSFRNYYAYTPQPDWNAAYNYIAAHKTNDDIVISSLPQFNKIFLHEAGYWIKYNYTGSTNVAALIHDDHEYYVNATVVDDLADLRTLTSTHHGYLVFDYMAFNGKIPYDIIEYVVSNFDEVFDQKTNYYSEVWVYKF